MVCSQPPSSIFIVIRGWLQRFTAARGKTETITKKLKRKEKKISEGRCYFSLIFTLQQMWLWIFNTSSLRLRTGSLHGLAIKTKLICKIPIHPWVQFSKVYLCLICP